MFHVFNTNKEFLRKKVNFFIETRLKKKADEKKKNKNKKIKKQRFRRDITFFCYVKLIYVI